MKPRVISLIIIYCLIISTLLGCEAFVRKFTRKSKKEKPAEEMVLVPEEYPSLFANKEEAYQQYFLYWKSWQDELIHALSEKLSHKKQLSCINQAIKNLAQIKKLLTEEKQLQLDSYITELRGLRNNIEIDNYSFNISKNRSTAEQLKRNILRDFSYSKIKDFLK